MGRTNADEAARKEEKKDSTDIAALQPSDLT